MLDAGKYKRSQSVFVHIQFFHPIAQGHILLILGVYQINIGIAAPYFSLYHR
jgi:hypothetical protein